MPRRAHLTRTSPLIRSFRQRPVPLNAGAVGRPGLVLTSAVVVLLGGCSQDESSNPLPVDAPTPAFEDRDACRTLNDALPEHVADQRTRQVDPQTDWAAAWGDPAIVLTCGGPPAEGFRRTSTCTTVNGVDWFIPEEQLETPTGEDLTMTTVNREQVVQVRMPAEYFPPATTLADLSSVVARSTEATGSCY